MKNILLKSIKFSLLSIIFFNFISIEIYACLFVDEEDKNYTYCFDYSNTIPQYASEFPGANYIPPKSIKSHVICEAQSTRNDSHNDKPPKKRS